MVNGGRKCEGSDGAEGQRVNCIKYQKAVTNLYSVFQFQVGDEVEKGRGS